MVGGFKKKKQKQKKCSSIQESVYIGEDRISGLPDSLIHHILSFLEMKDVIRTCTLSRRWRYLWTSAPVLDFGWWSLDDPTFIDLSLMLYESQKIRRFSVNLDCKVDACRMDAWIRFAVRHDVEELDIQSFCDVDEAGNAKFYRIPRCLLDCADLRVLKLRYCDLTLHSSFCFRSLMELHLSYIGLTDVDISGCPLLEKLFMNALTKTLNIYAPNQRLKLLKIKDSRDMLWKDGALTLYAPYLLSIEITGYLRQIYNFRNLSSIKSASLRFVRVAEYVFDSDHTQSLVELLKNLSHANTLKLSRWCIEIFDYSERNNLKTPPLSATCLELATSLHKSELVGIVSLLRSCHCVERLIINIKYFLFGASHLVDENKSWELLELALSADLQLATVIIHNFLGSEFHWFYRRPIRSLSIDKYLENLAGEMKLVKLLLKGCKVLDKMIIRTIEIPIRSLKSELLPRLMKRNF